MVKEEKEIKVKYKVGQVATQVAPAIIEEESGNAITMEEAICSIMNDVAEIKKKF